MSIDAHSHVDRYDLVDEQALGSAPAEITQHGILTIGNSMDLPSYERNLEISEMCKITTAHPYDSTAHRFLRTRILSRG